MLIILQYSKLLIIISISINKNESLWRQQIGVFQNLPSKVQIKVQVLQQSFNLQQGENLQEQSIFSKLLKPPSQNEIKKSQDNKKYKPKFTKPDLQNLIKENNNLKMERNIDRKTIAGLKIKNQELQKKLKKTQAINQQSLKVFEKDPNNNTIYSEILKKKIHDLNLKYLSAQNEIKQLKKLPNVSIYEENNLQKQYLISQTIRLKAILTVFQQDDNKNSKSQNPLLRMLKQQNQKLKATIRLLENDKVLLKSRHSQQNKFNNQLKKQIETLKQKLLYKEGQVQKLNMQNKNLLFKKANQFRIEEQRRESQQIVKLKLLLQQVKLQKKKITEQLNDLQEQHQIIKDKQKLKTAQLLQMQYKYQTQIKNYQDQLEQAHFQIDNVKSDYCTILNQGNLKKKKTITQNFIALPQIVKPIKQHQIQLSLYTINYCLNKGDIKKVSELFEDDQLRCSDIIKILQQPPIKLFYKEAEKLARYITQDQSQKRIEKNMNTKVNGVYCTTVINASINKLNECICSIVQQKWKCIFYKSKKLVQIIQSLQSDTISQQFFYSLISKNARDNIQKQDINYIVINCFNRQLSTQQIILNVSSLKNVINKLSNSPLQK